MKGQGLAENREYWHDIIGYNYRMTNICAAIGYSQLEQKEEILDKKRKLAESYKASFKNTDIYYHNESNNAHHSYWMFSVIMDITEDQRDGIRSRLPMYSSYCEIHPVSEKLSCRGFNIPSYPEISQNEINYVTQNIKQAFQEEMAK